MAAHSRNMVCALRAFLLAFNAFCEALRRWKPKPIISTLRRPRQEDCKFRASLSYRASPQKTRGRLVKTIKRPSETKSNPSRVEEGHQGVVSLMNPASFMRTGKPKDTHGTHSQDLLPCNALNHTGHCPVKTVPRQSPLTLRLQKSKSMGRSTLLLGVPILSLCRWQQKRD